MTNPHFHPSPPFSSPLPLTIRFSSATALPDLFLDIIAPHTIRIATLKQRIRPSLPAEDYARVIRLIYQGRILDDRDVVGTVVRGARGGEGGRGRRRWGEYVSEEEEEEKEDDDDKSKNDNQKEDEGQTLENKQLLPGPESGNQQTPDTHCHRQPHKKKRNKGKAAAVPTIRTYLIASLGPPLPELALQKEATLAALPPTPLLSPTSSTSLSYSPHPSPPTISSGSSPSSNTNPPEPRGFDRLATAGLTPSEIHQLRHQFLSLHIPSYSPSSASVPSPETLLRMEDAWLDARHNADGTDGTEALDGAAGGNGGEADAGLEALVWGIIVGFFWPVGCLVLGREGSGGRRGYAVGVGVVFGLGVGGLRLLGAEGGVFS